MSASFEVIDGVPTYNLFVGGSWTRASRNAVTDDFNPATGALYARVQQAGASETTQAIDAAAHAQKRWQQQLVAEREGVFHRAVDVLQTKGPEIIDVLVEETGSVVGKAGFEVAYC